MAMTAARHIQFEVAAVVVYKTESRVIDQDCLHEAFIRDENSPEIADDIRTRLRKLQQILGAAPPNRMPVAGGIAADAWRERHGVGPTADHEPVSRDNSELVGKALKRDTRNG